MADTSARGLILFAHGARDPQWALPFSAIRDAILKQAPDMRVELAFLELTPPRLAEAVASLAAAGVRDITVVPAFMAQGGHLKRDLPELVRRAQAAHPECVIHHSPPIGEAPQIVEAIARYAIGVAGEQPSRPR